MNEAQRITEWVEQKRKAPLRWPGPSGGFAEPNWRETQSAAAISAALEAEGFALERRPCGMETAFVATWGGEGPVIAFLANTTRCPRFPSRRAAPKKRRFARARQAMAAGTTCWARAALPQPWR